MRFPALQFGIGPVQTFETGTGQDFFDFHARILLPQGLQQCQLMRILRGEAGMPSLGWNRFVPFGHGSHTQAGARADHCKHAVAVWTWFTQPFDFVAGQRGDAVDLCREIVDEPDRQTDGLAECLLAEGPAAVRHVDGVLLDCTGDADTELAHICMRRQGLQVGATKQLNVLEVGTAVFLLLQ